jgi:hypothetical protein
MADEQQNPGFQLELPQNVATQPVKKGISTELKVFLWVIGIIGFIVLGIPLLVLVFCFLAMALSLALPLFMSFLGLVIMGFLFITYRETYKKRRNQLIRTLPYFGAVLFFGILFIGGYVHKDSNACNLVNVQTMIIQPLLSYTGLIASSILLYLKTK